MLGAEAVGAELRRSDGRSPLFVAATAIAKKDRQNFTRDDAMAIYTASRINQLRKSSSRTRNPTLRISDNGAGIEAAVIEKGRDGHFGLRGMRERADRIGAKFTLVSGPGIGTTITLLVPGRNAFRSE